MVKRILAILNKELSVNQAALILGVFAFLSQILGLLRDRALAHYLGPSLSLDVYYAAFRIPDFLYTSIASLASVTILLPFLIERIPADNNENLQQAKKLFSDVFTVFLSIIGIVSLIIAICMPWIAHIVAPGFSDEGIAMLVKESRIMLLSPILLGASNIFGSATQMFRRFFVYALSPVFYNIGILIGIFVLQPMFGIYGLAWGVVIGGLLHLAIQLPVLINRSFLPNFSWHIDWASIRKVVFLSLPRTLGLSLSNISTLVLIAIISKIGQGSISIFNFSYNLQSVPISIIGISYSVASFPTLVRFITSNERELFVRHIIEASKKIIFWSLPIIFLFIILRAQIVRVILGSGSFSWTHTRITAATLAIFAVSLVAQSLVHLFVRGYYAAGNTRKPLVINLFCAVLTIASAYGLIYLFDHIATFRYFIESLLRVDGLPGTEILMLPLAYSIGTIVNFFLLWFIFKRDFCGSVTTEISRTFLQSAAASFFIGFVAYEMLNILAPVFNLDTFVGIFLQGFLSGIAGIFVGIILLIALKNTEFKEIQSMLGKKLIKVPLIAEEQREL
jgi:putative peptidoglycan lipid II flippase